MTSKIYITSRCTIITDKYPDKNLGNRDSIYVGIDSYKYIYRALLSFDVTDIPSMVEIESAILGLYSEGVSGKNEAAVITPYLISSAWDQNHVKWESQPEINTSLAGSKAKIVSDGWYKWDICSLVRLWMADPKDNNGIMMMSCENRAGDRKKFCSHYGYNKGPYLEICYSSKPSFVLVSRYTANKSEEHCTQDTLAFTRWYDTAVYSTVTFFIQNIGPNPVHAFLQVSPNKSAIIDEPYSVNLWPGSTKALVPQIYGSLSRMAFRSLIPSNHTALKIWFQAQV
jgi:hypothetical protein